MVRKRVFFFKMALAHFCCCFASSRLAAAMKLHHLGLPSLTVAMGSYVEGPLSESNTTTASKAPGANAEDSRAVLNAKPLSLTHPCWRNQFSTPGELLVDQNRQLCSLWNARFLWHQVVCMFL
jgi:hypothetical protein